ncbi:MAG TPA: hypothetical protein VG457_18070 [Planctomycetota bacterium]|jgi:hypothetical protein|nr:hypothetical protein [Planctomycetota bacterium]
MADRGALGAVAVGKTFGRLVFRRSDSVLFLIWGGLPAVAFLVLYGMVRRIEPLPHPSIP